ncbi:hypothetical protein IQ250_22750 [Pseudanabaenaceae cyanobacterium LEGE 13415]|nr:hypothetical protein [Pseudanabaenaceae cyanobacterium LEGE 13415]
MPAQAHEIFKKLIGFLLKTFFFEKQVNAILTGSVTQEQAGEASAQANQSYCFGGAKPISNLSVTIYRVPKATRSSSPVARSRN